MIIILLLVIVVVILTLVYLNGRYNEYYWKKRGVVFHSKNKIMGPMWNFLTENRSLFEIYHDYYKQYPNEPAVGIGSFLTPAIYVRDPENVRHVLQTDFQNFNHRGIEVSDGDVLADNILFMNGKRWKLVRQNMNPLFTAAKLKNMYYIIDKSAQDVVQYFKQNPEKFEGNAFDTMNTFCSAAIGAAVFGITTDSIFDSPFLKMARDAVAPTFVTNLKFAISTISSSTFKTLGLTFFKEHEKFFVGAIKQVIRLREKENVKRHDFAELCVSLQKNGTMIDAETGLQIEPSDEVLAAQAFFFFLAGVEPTATAIFVTFIELARNPEILEKLQKEIDETFEKYNGQLSYDAIMEMSYLEKVLNEALRMFPPIGFLTRQCIRDTVLPVGNIKIDKGTKVFTPIYEIHHDPNIYPNPEVFDPERFDNDSKSGDITYMPFGKGNRICLGMRYARLQAKAGIVHILRHFTLKLIVLDGSNKIKFAKNTVQVRPSNVDVEFIPRKIKSN